MFIHLLSTFEQLISNHCKAVDEPKVEDDRKCNDDHRDKLAGVELRTLKVIFVPTVKDKFAEEVVDKLGYLHHFRKGFLMRLVHGFVTKSDYISNEPGVVSKAFELSPFGLTYSKTRGEYQSSTYPGDILHTFKTVDLSTQIPFELTDSEVREVLSIVASMVTYVNSNYQPYDPADFVSTMMAEHVSDIANFAHGEFISSDPTSVPEWMSWDSLKSQGLTIKIWLVNDSFESQYSNYEIVTVAPFDSVDRFFETYNGVVTALAEISTPKLLERIQVAKEGNPETYTRVLSFDYVNQNNPNQKTSVTFGVLIYGLAGDHIDSIKDAIVEHLLSNSTRDQPHWERIFPDLFKRTEFLIYPRWDLIAVPNLTELSALYSSIIDPMEALQFAKRQWNHLSPAWVENNLHILPVDYKAVSLLTLAGETNVEGKKDLKKLFPDYLPMGTSTLDFNRMTPKTREWVLKIVELLIAAEKATEHSSVPTKLRRVYRNEVLYISAMYDDVNYLIAAKSNIVR